MLRSRRPAFALLPLLVAASLAPGCSALPSTLAQTKSAKASGQPNAGPLTSAQPTTTVSGAPASATRGQAVGAAGAEQDGHDQDGRYQDGQAIISDAVAALEADQQMDLADMAIGEDAAPGYRTQGLGRRLVPPRRLVREAARMRQIERAMVRLAASDKSLQHKAAQAASRRRAMAAARLADFKASLDSTSSYEVSTDPASGLTTASGSLRVTSRQGTHVHTFERVTNSEGVLLSAVHDLSSQHSQGLTRTARREREANEQGGYTDTFDSRVVRADGATKTVRWVRVGQADGSAVADGTLTRFDGSTVTVHIERTAEGKITLTAKDSGRKLDVSVKKDEAVPSAETSVKQGEAAPESGTIADTAAMHPGS